ncbi:MAG: alpha/beta hydrolase [Dehalococcoidia bacterium]|nr:alpha/beta hydrolase [Dehalococcoidia bacterium]
MTAIRRAYAETPLGQIHYRVAGPPDGQPLLLLHQSPSSSAMWEPALPMFGARGYRAIAVDLLGHGMSDPAPANPTLTDYAAGVWGLVDTLSLGPSPIVGHHSGAAVAVIMAVMRPPWVTALALWGVPILTPALIERLVTEQRPDWRHAEDWLGQRWIERTAASGPEWTPAVSIRALMELTQAGPTAHLLHNAVGTTLLDPILPTLAQPMLAICGERDILWQGSQRAATMAPRARFVALPGAGVDVVDYQTEAFVTACDSFFRDPDV